MHKLVVLYPEPENRESFINYYTVHHLPLAARLPGLLGWRYSMEISDSPAGAAPYFAIFEAEFADAGAFQKAMASTEGRAVADDVPKYATGGAVVMDYAVSQGSVS